MKSNHPQSKSRVQGEGDYRSAEKYNQKAHEFAESGKVEQAAKDAAPRNDAEKNEMKKAEAEGRSHAKGTSGAKGAGSGQPKPAQRAPGIDPLDTPVPEKLSGSQATHKS
ncbi:MAG TPA: hypothetical protein PLE48_10715 [Thiobacillus sp.]|nr:MAG: hypothetical protein B7Y50_05950 [Hydrogenophilales bacterium 28-61-11]OYZ56733.1 MAG: hypothetical protein B7Y21_10245 [Hydrogenophilales bacterium 16-61-112]OZA44631.1 MAG: hypothetical protein B7X81_09795 [Hydrogenophilales bacterium 17-61-76]HQT29978.1 hypothetical protein [Thiobacillus sp.]HQT70886.1 hypothetical protein [Thiobacillus sp.]